MNAKKKKASITKDSKRNTSLRLDSNTLKALKIRAIEKETSVQAIVEQLITDYLNNKIKLRKSRK